MPEYRGFRVMRPFWWNGWSFSPRDGCHCDCGHQRTIQVSEPDQQGRPQVGSNMKGIVVDGPIPDCKSRPGMSCRCSTTVCECPCGLPEATYAGDIWIADVGGQLERQEGRVYAMVEISRFARPEVVAHETVVGVDGEVKVEFKKLLSPPSPELLAAMGSHI